MRDALLQSLPHIRATPRCTPPESTPYHVAVNDGVLYPCMHPCKHTDIDSHVHTQLCDPNTGQAPTLLPPVMPTVVAATYGPLICVAQLPQLCLSV